MVTLPMVEREAVRLGAKFERSQGRNDGFAIEAPKGMIFKGHDVHEHIYEWTQGFPEERKDALDTAMKDMKRDGFTKCTTEDCEWCNDL